VRYGTKNRVHLKSAGSVNLVSPLDKERGLGEGFETEPTTYLNKPSPSPLPCEGRGDE
jgi:hypothetical protein